MEYHSATCSFCHKPFAEGDDIVVCPECGAPYHRDCYAKAGGCVFQAKHGTGFAFQSPEEDAAPAGVRCAVCGAQNAPDSIFCNHCGHALSQEAPPRTGGASQGPAYTRAPEGPPQSEQEFIAQLNLKAEYDGFSSEEWTSYIGRSAPYYLYQFSRMDESHRKTSVCWSAFLFAPVYFFFRKMWAWGALALVSSILFSIPTLALSFQEMGFAVPIVLSAGAMQTLYWVCLVLQWGSNILFAMYAFYLFRRHAVRRLQTLRAGAADEASFKEVLTRKGGPSVLGVVFVFLVLMAVSGLLVAWLVPTQTLPLAQYF